MILMSDNNNDKSIYIYIDLQIIDFNSDDDHILMIINNNDI